MAWRRAVPFDPQLGDFGEKSVPPIEALSGRKKERILKSVVVHEAKQLPHCEVGLVDETHKKMLLLQGKCRTSLRHRCRNASMLVSASMRSEGWMW